MVENSFGGKSFRLWKERKITYLNEERLVNIRVIKLPTLTVFNNFLL